MAAKHSTTKTLRAAGYCRTSGEGQRNNTSIPTQKEFIEEHCKREGWKLVRHYVDESKSGSKIEGRDDFQLLMRDAANGKFDIVVVFDITRLSRDGFDIIESSRTLKKDFGVNVVDTKGGYDTRQARNTIVNFVQAGISEDERVRILERTTLGRIRTAKEGKPWCANRPVGRDYDKKTGRWFVNEKGKAIQQILRRYLTGESLTALCREFGVLRSSKMSDWVWHGQLSGTYVARCKAEELGIDVEIPIAAMPEVIPKSLLKRVRARLRHNRTHNRHDVRNYPLSGFIRCGDCRAALTGQTQASKVVYYRHKSPACSIQSVRGDQLEPAVLDYLYNFFLDEPAFNEAVKRAMPPADHRKRLVKEQSRTKKRLADNDRKIKRLVNAIADGADVELLLSKQDQLKDEKAALTQRLQGLESQIAALPSLEHMEAAAMLTRLRLVEEHKDKDWRELPHEEVKRFLFHLFGETTKDGGTGIFVKRNEQGRLVVTFKGRVDFYHLIVNGRPVSKVLEKEAARLNDEINKLFQRAVQAADEEYRRASNELKPSPDYELSGPPARATVNL